MSKFENKGFTPSQTEIVLSTKEFGYWKVIEEDKTKARYVLCQCECGNVKSIRVDSLIKGDSTSCGCYAKEATSKRFKGVTKPNAVYRHPLYRRYTSMFSRCYNKNNQDYKWYGGRGIRVDDRWISPKRDTTGFKNFLEDMEGSYRKGLELERLDVNKNYSPDNCKWVTRQSQLHNMTRNRKLKGWGVELTVTEWGYLLKFNGKRLDDRINKLKWEGRLEVILEDTFKDRQHELLYKGKICNAREVWTAAGFTDGQRNYRLTKHGGDVEALIAEGIEFEVVKPREKEYLSFEEALTSLRKKERDDFEEHLLYKIEAQLKENNIEI